MGNEVGTKVPPLDEIKDNEDVFLVLPSYAEPFSQKIRQIIFAEKQKCTLGFHLSALGGLCCDHGNKLMWGNYSSRTGTFFCIQLYSRNVNHICLMVFSTDNSEQLLEKLTRTKFLMYSSSNLSNLAPMKTSPSQSQKMRLKNQISHVSKQRSGFPDFGTLDML